ncbi:protein of unknown function [Modestobacter italicus]|uniref:DUF6869 domain-containing protein n=1 Tax=Modestobacter italicus (strain DSM 44449 / CECT 9708 / BC 501) TaxID=2732864 RepID=I4F3C9_MODI5|nr:hypothetical protein [Modestobacter marinus]CCH90142.1 protein of unknown function [Modestobacter marinus]
MFESEATFRPDGSCLLVDVLAGTQRTWPSVTAWAADWFAEWRAGEHGDASDFAGVACDAAAPGVVGALVVLADAAEGDADLIAWVGAGPVEDLLSHSGNGLRVLDEVDRAARRQPAFRAALGTVVLGNDVPEPVVTRLAELTALGPHQC